MILPSPEWFFKRVEVTSSCWLWTRSLRRGYGDAFYLYQRWPAHRLAYLIFRNDVPDELDCCHTCDVKRCANPWHIVLGDNQYNRTDAAVKGLMRHGAAHPRATLSFVQLSEIRKRYECGSVRQQDLAAEFGITQSAVSKIVLFQTRERERVRLVNIV